MKKYLLFIMMILVTFCFADAPDGYYDSVEGLSGETLKQGLNDIIGNHTEYSYDYVWDILKESDEDPDNPANVRLFYTGWSRSKSGYPLWNREHTWAKSHGDFGTSMGPGTDAHHLRPTDCSVNSARGNKDFDNGGSEYIDGDGATGCYSDSDSWEPRDEVKGDVARIIFYMATRYEGENGELDLEVNDLTGNSPQPLHGRLSALLEWNEQDPVDEFEMHRNDVIFENWQHNRNPFIDHPEFVNEIWENGGGGEPEIVTISEIQFTEEAGDDGTYPSLYNGQSIETEGIITAKGTGENTDCYYLQMEVGEPWSGVYLYATEDNSLNVGDKIELSANVTEYFGLTELINASDINVLSSGNELPLPIEISTSDLSENESYEGVFVQLNYITIASLVDDHGQFYVNDGSGECQIDDLFIAWEDLDQPLVVGEEWRSIRGVVDYGYGEYGLNPRILEDMNYETSNSDEIDDSSLKVSKNYPNPFNLSKNDRNNTTRIDFTLEERSRVEVSIFNIKGQKVKSIGNKEYSAGDNYVEWNGTDEDNLKVNSGIYFYQIETDSAKILNKMLIIK